MKAIWIGLLIISGSCFLMLASGVVFLLHIESLPGAQNLLHIVAQLYGMHLVLIGMALTVVGAIWVSLRRRLEPHSDA